MSGLTAEELAFELFPDGLFRNDFQQELGNVYDIIARAMEYVRMPIKSYDLKDGWNVLYDLSFYFKSNYIVQNEVDMVFYKRESNRLLGGFIHINPEPEPSLEPIDDLFEDSNLLASDNSEKIIIRTNDFKMVIPTSQSIEMYGPKHFERNIFFVDVCNLTFLLERFKFHPIILNEAAKRFPKKGLIAVELNKIWNVPKIIYPSSSQFPKLINFAEKMDKIIRTEVSKSPEDQ